jgi:hypothetical protein
MMGWPRHVALVEEMRNACEILVGKPQGKRPPETCRLRLEGNIKIDSKIVECVHWIHMVNDGEYCQALMIKR